MAELLIKHIDEKTFQHLEASASHHGTSVEVEAKKVLEGINNPFREDTSKEDMLARMKAFREKTAHLQTSDSVDLLREDRDR